MSVFSNIFNCCNRGKDSNEIVNNNLKNEKENFPKIKSSSSKTKITNFNSKITNIDYSQKKYSFISPGTYSIINDKEKNKNEIQSNKNENNSNENQNLIISKYPNNEINNSIYNISSKRSNSNINIKDNNNISLEKRKCEDNLIKKNSIISNILFENSLTSQTSSSLKDFTEILNKTISKSSSSKKMNRENKTLLFDSNFEIKSKKGLILDFDNIILDEEIELAPKLIISDYKNSNLFNGKIIKIDASGFNNGFRQKRDGMTIFGLKKMENNEIINDIIVNFNEQSNYSINTLFVIFYDRKKAHYFIQNLNNDIKNNKFMMYIKIYEYYLENDKYNKYFLLGNTIMSVLVSKDNIINLKIFDDKNHEKFNEYKYRINNSPISIGREGCLININNPRLSRTHLTFIFDNSKNKWKIIDGNGLGKYSTHGTWFILSNKKFDLCSNSEDNEVKIGNQKFLIKIKNE